MNYTKYTIHTTIQAKDLICGMLYELGITSVEILDDDFEAGEFDDYEELLPKSNNLGEESLVSFYLEENAANEADLLESVKTGLEELRDFTDIGQAEIEKEISREEDWRDNWKEFFKAFEIEDVFIRPTWDDLDKIPKNKTIINVDPGTSFGTGKHESTQLCIKGMNKYLKDGMRVLDVGCGSGILSVIALKKGASFAAGTDIDPVCMDSVKENFEFNDLDSNTGFFKVGDLTNDAALKEMLLKQGPYEIVFANILADIIIGMADALFDVMSEGSVLITSGIIDFKEAQVKQALEKAGLKVLETNYQGEWVSIILVK